MADRADRSPRSQEGRAPSVFQRALSAVRSPFGVRGPAQRTASDGDDRSWVRQSGVRSSSVGVPRWDSQERGTSTRISFGTPFVIQCGTCNDDLPTQQAERCCGCERYTHMTCQHELPIGDTCAVWLCFVCSAKVSQWIRIVDAVELRHSHYWRRDGWFRELVETTIDNMPLVDTRNPIRNKLESFLWPH